MKSLNDYEHLGPYLLFFFTVWSSLVFVLRWRVWLSSFLSLLVGMLFFFGDALALSDDAPLYSLDCTATKAVLTINQAMTPISCTGTMSFAPRITPDLPTGMTYSITSVGRQHTIVISGTPKQGLNPRLFYVGYNAHVSTIEISGRALVLLLIF